MTDKQDHLGIECKHVHQVRLDRDRLNASYLKVKQDLDRFTAGTFERERAEISLREMNRIKDSNHLMHDAVLIKTVTHEADGTFTPHVQYMMDYERPFWVTKPEHRNFKQKKTWYPENKCTEYKSNDAFLPRAITKALGYGQGGLKQVANQFVFGTDVTSPVLIKQHYREAYPDIFHESTLAVLDIETCVNAEFGMLDEPIYVALTMRDKVFLSVNRKYASRFEKDKDVYLNKLKKVVHAELSNADFGQGVRNIVEERSLNIEYHWGHDALDCIKEAMQYAHKWKPDFITCWNINFDLPRIERFVVEQGGDMGDIMTDPCVPEPWRTYEYVESPAKRITAKGTTHSFSFYQRWHQVRCLSSFVFIDQAAVFYDMRKAGGKEASMALDAIVKKHAGIGKLKSNSSDLGGLEWHIKMQKEQPYYYGAYNVFDCIACEMLDEMPKVGDMRSALPVLIESTHYSNALKLPRKACDSLHFFLRKNGLVMASTGASVLTEEDKLTLPCRDYIVTLPTHSIEDNGLKICRDFPDLRSMIRALVFDLDLKSAYPLGEDVMNASRETARREISSIEGKSVSDIHMLGFNLSCGVANSLEIGITMFGAPHVLTLFDAFNEDVMQK